MTEQQWLAWSGDPGDLHTVVRDKISERKLRLFACACFRRVLHLVADLRSRNAVEVGELFADGKIDGDALTSARSAAHAASYEAATATTNPFSTVAHAAAAAFFTVTSPGILTFAAANRAASCIAEKKEAEQKVQSALFRHMIGNPFRRFSAPDRCPATVVQLSNTLYYGQDCAFALHDALLDAGHADLAQHFREEKEHPKGCWALDLLLGRE